MSDTTSVTEELSAKLQTAVNDILDGIAQDREKEIIGRRFGLSGRKETLEHIGEMLGITRERVRQLEKAILIRIRMRIEEGAVPSVTAVEKIITTHLAELGRAARVDELTTHIFGHKTTGYEKAQVAFIAELSQHVTIVSENDDFYHAAIASSVGDEKSVKKQITDIVKAIKTAGQPVTADTLHETMNYEHPSHISALASLSKKLARLKGNWGLTKWPTVNPRNIRDKIFVILDDAGKPMHFSAIAGAIKDSDFKRKDVTTQAIHNELIKDKRFVLIGRGIYALQSWGYSRGTVSDIITQVLKDAGEPLHRDEIVRRVLKSRQVKETTILLNLQSKPQFQRTAKATYALTEQG